MEKEIEGVRIRIVPEEERRGEIHDFLVSTDKYLYFIDIEAPLAEEHYKAMRTENWGRKGGENSEEA